MTEIISINKQIAPELTQTEAMVIRDASLPKVRDMEKKSIVKEIQQIYAKTKIETHMNLKETQQDELALCLLISQDILKDFKTLTIREIATAFRNGSRGVYGEYMFLSVTLFYNWMKAFKFDKNRSDILMKQREWEESLREKKLDEREKRNLLINGLKKIFTCYTKKEYFNDLNNHGYDFLDGCGHIDFSGVEKKEMLEEARMQIEMEEKNPHIKHDKLTKDQLSEMVETLASKQPREVRVAKKIALTRFFDELVAEKKTIEDLFIDQK